jgi:hypothetical protein
VCGHDRLGVGLGESDVKAVRERTVSSDWEQCQQELVVVTQERATVGFEHGPELEVLLIERSTRHGITDSEVQVAELHFFDPPKRLLAPPSFPGDMTA